MTVTAFRLENFMAFADTGWIELRPITLLFGRNSSGKSAIIRALRLLGQSLNTSPDSPLRFIDEYGLDVGSYPQIAHGYHPTTGEQPPQITFHFRCSTPAALDNARSLLNEWRQNMQLPTIAATKDDYLTLSVTFGNDPHHGSELRNIQLSCSWNVSEQPDQHLLLAAYRLSPEDWRELNYEWWLSSDFPLLTELEWKQTSIEPTTGFLPNLSDPPRPELGNIWTELCETIRTFLIGIEYLGTMRPEPQQIYLFDEVTRQQWRQRGWGVFLDFLEDRLDYEKLVKVDQWLQTLDLGEQIRPPVVAKGKEFTVARIEIEQGEAKLPINLKNTGYGASQVIPIIIQSVTARQRVTKQTSPLVIIEQPERHLHPRAQSRLADVFVDAIYRVVQQKDEEGNIETIRNYTDVFLILETHSEDLLLRLRRRIAESAIGKHLNSMAPNLHLETKDVGMYFVHRWLEKQQSSITLIPLNKFGDLLEKPEGFAGFFSNDLQELRAITSAKLEAPEE